VHRASLERVTITKKKKKKKILTRQDWERQDKRRNFVFAFNTVLLQICTSFILDLFFYLELEKYIFQILIDYGRILRYITVYYINSFYYIDSYIDSLSFH